MAVVTIYFFIALTPQVSPLHLVIIMVIQANQNRLLYIVKIAEMVEWLFYSFYLCDIIRSIGVIKRAMYAAKNLLLLHKLLQHTGRP